MNGATSVKLRNQSWTMWVKMESSGKYIVFHLYFNKCNILAILLIL